MITALAQYIAGCLLHNDIIEGEKLDIYIYGFEVMISSISGFTIALILGFAFSQPLECILFLITFVSMRSYCGGYHADTYLKCNSIFAVTITAVMLLFKFVPQYPIYIHFWIGVFSLGTVIIFAPVENKFKPLDIKTKKKCKWISILLTVLFSSGAVLLDDMFSCFSVVIDTALLVVAVSVMIEIIRKQGEHNERD